jgi:outer membrane receptor protein involved in Fe transport
MEWPRRNRIPSFENRSTNSKGARAMNRSRSTHRHRPRNVTPPSRGFQRQAWRRLPLASAISAVLAGGVPLVQAASDTAGGPSDTLEEVTVTAQKVTENLQNVPISIETLGNQKLEELNITNLDDYVEYLPGVTTVKGLGQGGNGVGTTHVYMRGVVSGQDGNHSASQPSVGTYFDEQPVTTIDGTVDMHIYDIQRIEVLEGPQGTLYGASSEAGTIRIISNKPDPTKFSAAFDVSGQAVYNGGQGSVAEGYVNIPLSPNAAVRIVAWDEHDPGYISSVGNGTNANAGIINGQRTFPTWSAANNGETFPEQSEPDYNTVHTLGGRVALKLDINDNWTVTPTFMGQRLAASGFFAYDPAVGPLELAHSGPENLQDSFTQSALAIEGKVSDFDITYTGGWFTRNTHSIADYQDYTFWYDKYYGSGCLWVTQSGYNAAQSNPAAKKGCALPAGSYTEGQEFVITRGHYTKWNQELRVSTPQEYPVNGTAGLFAERQVHEIWEQYTMPGLDGNPYTTNPQGLAPSLGIPGVSGNTIWLTDEERVDRDEAAFIQANWDITSSLQLTGGFRQYHYNNTLQGFYGYSEAYDQWSGFYPGQNICGPPGGPPNPNYAPFHFAPCTDLNGGVTGKGHTELGRLTYKIDPDHLVYATYSTGYRPGGVNRVYDAEIKAIFPPYKADYLKNYEVGWKTQWLDESLRWNGALFWDDWNDFQFTYLGPNSVTVVQNAPSATIKGIETNAEWRVGGGWLFSGSATFIDAKLTSNFCGNYIPGTTQLITNCPKQVSGAAGNLITYADGSTVIGPYAPSGTRLPVVPRFKANLIARYNFPLGDWNGFGQAAYVYQDSSTPLLFPSFYQTGNNGTTHLGEMPPYSLVNLSAGGELNKTQVSFLVNNVFNSLGEIGRFAACTPTMCNQPYVVPVQPRTFWLKLGYKFQ